MKATKFKLIVQLPNDTMKEFILNEQTKTAIESDWNAYLRKTGKNIPILMNGITFTMSQIKNFLPCEYENGEKTPAYKFWFCDECGSRNPSTLSRCQCKEIEIQRKSKVLENKFFKECYGKKNITYNDFVRKEVKEKWNSLIS